MSALTKIFIVLHVVISLLLTAGLIVFVNHQEHYKQTTQDALAKAAVAQDALAMVKQDNNKIAAQRDAVVADMRSQNEAKDVAVKAAEDKVRMVETANVDLTARIASFDSQIVSLNGQIAEKDKQLAAQFKVDDDLKKDREKVFAENSDFNRRINALTNERDVVKKHDKYMAELNSDLQTQLTAANELLRKYNINASPSEKAVLNVEPNVNINGVVRDFKQINGVPWATISLGSADAVTKGMQFKVVNPGQGFIGYLTVDTVNIHDAVGRLDGPHVNDVRPNVTEVRTQVN